MKLSLKPLSLFLLSILFSPLLALAEPIDHSEKSWNEWKKDKPPEENSWLTLAGLYWLKEDVSTLGSAADNTHQFPKGTPAHFGSVELSDKGVFFTAKGTSFKTQLTADSGSKIIFDHFAFSIIERESTFAIRLQDFENPAIENFKPSVFYSWQKDYLIPAKFIPEKEEKQLQIQTFYGTLRPMPAAGWIEFELDGKMQRLHAVDSGEGEPMFVMFKDLTSESETYGAGRYLYVERPDKNGKMVIDFNRAYNPPCAITVFATCPLPPKSNNLKVKVTAGEKYYGEY